jgi:capsular polysaccharide biosynthesis protein
VSDERQRLSSNDQVPTLSRVDGLNRPARLWADDDDDTAVEDRYAELGTGLVSLAFLRAAIRRGARFWCAMALLGPLVGLAAYLAFPPGYQATTDVLLTFGPYENSSSAAVDYQVIAQSRAVAALALHKLRLTESASSFLGEYTAAAVSERVLLITVTAQTGDEAVRRAGAVAQAFLELRAGHLEADQKLVIDSIHQQIKRAKQRLASISDQMAALSAQPPSPEQTSKLKSLRAERSQQVSTLNTLRQGTSAVSGSTATELAVKRSVVIVKAALAPHSRLKPPLFESAIGLVAGLALGLGIVVVRALISDRLRRRGDVARALGAPVELSVPKVSISRWRPGRRGLAAAGSKDIARIVIYLGGAVAPTKCGFASLAVVPVDDVQAAAVCLTSLAISAAEQGLQVVLADLCVNAPAARLLGVRGAGVAEVSVEETPLVVAAPDRDDIAPEGPLHRGSRGIGADEDLATACASADLLLTLVPLDPAIGGEHLSEWASSVVVFVTAGRSSGERIKAVGEMIRLAGMPLVSAILIGADKTDETLGMTYMPGSEYQADRV